MLSNTLHTIVEAAVNAELIDAKRTYGDHYAGPHEGYGVLMEELHEATVELRDLDSAVTEQLIEDVHEDDLGGMVCTLADVELTARRLACEAIQVAAVARKMSETCAAMASSVTEQARRHLPLNGEGKEAVPTDDTLANKTPVQRFLLVLRELLNEGDCKLLDLRDAFPSDFIPACYMDFHDRDRFYLYPQRIYDKVEEVLQARGLSLEVSPRELWRLLCEKRFLQPDHDNNPCKGKNIRGKTQRLLWISKQVVREADGRG